MGFDIGKILPLLNDLALYDYVILSRPKNISTIIHKGPFKLIRVSDPIEDHGGGVWDSNGNNLFYAEINWNSSAHSPVSIESHTPANNALERIGGGFKLNWKTFSYYDGTMQHLLSDRSLNYYQPGVIGSGQRGFANGAAIKAYVAEWKPPGEIWDISAFQIPSIGGIGEEAPKKVYPPNTSPTQSQSRPTHVGCTPSGSPIYYLPSPPPPEEEKKMECCDMIKDLHKYLGIARLKKDKFKFSKAFMVPGGKGHENCEDYYEIYQSIVKMLANGLILNPISKPLGKGFMSANATSWAADMYEMAAETMSDGNSSQRYEVAAIMQSAQILSILAETARKVEFLADAIGIEPKLITEEIPCCFTVFEGHKGFDKKQSKKIDITKAKTDNDVEALLAKMYQPSLIPITKWQFSPNSISIIEALRGQ